VAYLESGANEFSFFLQLPPIPFSEASANCQDSMINLLEILTLDLNIESNAALLFSIADAELYVFLLNIAAPI
jgi:hypothetical protein